MIKNEKHRKAIRFIAKALLYIMIFWFTQTLVDVNRPARLGVQKVDTIKIMGATKVIYVSDQARIEKFIDQMKYKFVYPSYYKETPLNEGYYVLAFFRSNKLVGIFAYNVEKKLLQPRGKPFSSELYDIIEAFIKESYKLN